MILNCFYKTLLNIKIAFFVGFADIIKTCRRDSFKGRTTDRSHIRGDICVVSDFVNSILQIGMCCNLERTYTLTKRSSEGNFMVYNKKSSTLCTFPEARLEAAVESVFLKLY